MKEFFTARELAETAQRLGVEGFPKTTRGVDTLVKRNGWADLPPNLCRPRTGRVGGGREYHLSLMPDRLQTALGAESAAVRSATAEKTRRAEEGRQLVALPHMSLTARQRTVMERRSEVLLAIARYELTHGASRATAIRDFVAAERDYLSWTAAADARDRGEIVDIRAAALLHSEPRLLDPVRGFGIGPDVIRIANNRPTGAAMIGRSTLYDWFRQRAEGGVHALAPALTREEQPIPEGFAEFLRHYARPSKPCVTEALRDYLDGGTGPALTIDQVRHTLKHKLNDIERNVGREGLLTLRSRLPYIQRITDNLFPTTIYTADGKTFDAEVADPRSGRPMKPEITSILDVATRLCVGFAISRKENREPVTEALRRACIGHGIPAIFYTDRGPGYKNKAFDAEIGGLMGRLSITKMHALPYNSQAKGIIERFNRTVWNPLAQKLPTYLGADMDKEAAKAAHKRTRSDIAEFGRSAILPSWDAFRAMCEAAVARYNETPHSGLPKIEDPVSRKMRHMTPAEAWAAHVREGFEPVLVEEDLRDDLFRPYEERKARRGIVEWNTNTYFHQALEAYHNEIVLVGYDDADAERVWVRELDRSTGQPGPLICVATFSGGKVDYIPRSLQQVTHERRARGQLRRLDRKRDDILAEAGVPLLEHRVEQHVTIWQDRAAELVPAVPPANADAEVVTVAPAPAAGAPLTFATDEAFAAWAQANPQALSAGQIALLRRCLGNDAITEVFRLSGLDVEALRAIVRAAA